MDVGNVRIERGRAEGIAHAIGNNAETLIAIDCFAERDLKIGKELIFCNPAIAMIDFEMADA